MVARKKSPRVEIEYCAQCRFILRAVWMAEEILMTFSDELGEVALIPGVGGIYTIKLDGKILFSKDKSGGFPEIKEIKQKIRDQIAPEKSLGHSDRR